MASGFSGLIVILAALVPLIVQLINVQMSAKAKESRRDEEIDEAIKKNNADAVTQQLNTMLGQLRN